MNPLPFEARFPILKLAVTALAIVAALALTACHRPSQNRPEAAASAKHPAPAPPPPFTERDTAIALDALKHAPDHGFALGRFQPDEIERLLGSGAPSDQAEGRRRLRAAVLDYARAQQGLTIPIGALPAAWKQRPSTYDAGAALDAALRAGALQAWLEGLPPQIPEYQALQAAYVAEEAIHHDKPRPRVEPGPLDIGAQDGRTAALRKRLSLEDHDLADVDPDTPVDEALVDALRAYQARHGLDDTGVVDEATAEQLNAPALSKAAKLRVNMERLRWLPRPRPETRIEVNIAAADMRYFRDGQLSTHMLAVSGKPGDETPILSSAIDSIVLDPPWYVPADIAHREIIPKGAAYMESRHFVWRDGRIIQKPGPKTALGLVKFDFPNPYAVYLHDTPSKASFSLTQRTASHGCVRLQHAVELARVLAADEPGLSAERVDAILASGKTVRLKLERPVPVWLIYLTTEPKADGVTYLPDVYGWDAKLLALLDRYQTPRRRR